MPEADAALELKQLIETLSPQAKAVLGRVLDIEKSKLHMGNPYKIVDEIKAAIIEGVK